MDTSSSSVNQQFLGVAHDTTLSDRQPSLDEVLNNDAPHPYTLDSFTAYMSQAHCLEILEFILEGRRYRDIYKVSSVVVESSISPACRDSRVLLELWQQLLSTYIHAGSPREINLGSSKRQDLIAYHDPEKPPAPAVLDVIEQEMLDLLSQSIFPSFLKHIMSRQGAATFLCAPYGNATVCISSAGLSPSDGQTKAYQRPSLETEESNISFGEPVANHNTGSSSRSLPLEDFSTAVDIHSVSKTRRISLSKLRTILGLPSRKENESISGR
jgi:hypothetical protein